MLYPQLEQRLQASKQAVNSATSESIVKQCKEYLALLAEYRSQLYELQGTPGLNHSPHPLPCPKKFPIGKRFVKQ
jgi:hypothetical protein